MAYENLCMYCFEDMGGKLVCPHCGRDSRTAVPQVQLLPGSMVHNNRFLIGRALGQDATGIVYSAFDTRKENRLRIREYLPRDCAQRLNDGAVVPVAGMEDQFEAGIKKLRASVENVEDPHKRHFFFEENGTAYIAQRKSAGASSSESAGEAEEEDRGTRGRVLMFAGIAVAVLVVAAVLLITVFNGAVTGSRDLTQTPTLDPDQLWIPTTTPTATPYVSPTFAALVDPDLSWMDYTYDGDVEQEYRQAEQSSRTPVPTQAATPTAVPEPTGTSRYSLINANSGRDEITALQKRLAELGWLSKSQITGSYDSATRQAVKDFQSYINQHYNPGQRLSVDGAAGPKTQQWLYEVNAVKPTPTPTPKVTPKPDDGTVDANASADKIRAVQQKLIILGLMPEGSDDGSYGSTTAKAVRRFQERVNELAGYDVLEVTGSMDPQSLAFLDYYAEEWLRLRKATAVPTATPKPTATPTTRPVEDLEGVIDANASPEDIKKVQQLLIDIGMLPAGSADGIYGSATISAVADFQQWVNAQRQEQTLTVNGEVDQLTLAYLQYCVDHAMRPYGTPAPTAAPTTQAPTPTPEPDGSGDEPGEDNEISIGADSDPESIRYIQRMLSAVGLMSEDSADGIYGSVTRSAVEKFQRWVNRVRGEGSLAVTGEVDDATRRALEYAYDHDLRADQDTSDPTAVPTAAPTATPTAAPTATPTAVPTDAPGPDDEYEGGEISIGADSDPESIRFVQQMLCAVGLMDEDSADGVYGAQTVNAVRRFQAWVNSVRGEDVLPVTGQVDDRTRQALEYAYDHDLTIDSGSAGENEDESSRGVGAVGDVRIAIGDTLAGDDVVTVSEGSFAVRWQAEGDVDSYYVYVQNSTGDSVYSNEATRAESFNVDTSYLTPGEVYTLRLGVLPEHGTQDDVVWRTVKFTLPLRQTPEPTPAVGQISEPEISIAGVKAGSSVVVIEDDSFLVAWDAGGDVESYYVRITDSDNREITAQNTAQTGGTLPAGSMEPGMVYTLTVGAMPVNGTQDDIKYSQARFMRPAEATPTPTATPTPEPTATPTPVPARVGKPVITVDGSAYQQDGISYMTSEKIIISWNADGDVASYTIYMENQAGETQEVGTTSDTSRAVSTRSLPAGVYTVHVGALPVNGGRDDMQWGSASFGIPSPTQAPTEVPTQAPTPIPDSSGAEAVNITGPITGSSDADSVQQLQMRLYMLGLLSTDGLEPGVLDRKTLQAVADFQTRMNEMFDAGLPVVDPDDLNAVVDEITLQAILSASETIE